MSKILKLHHSAYRCKDSEETRKFYEDFLELKLVKVLEIKNTKTNRSTDVLHTFYQLEDKSCIAFFEEPATDFNFKDQRDFDLHIALEVTEKNLHKMYKKHRPPLALPPIYIYIYPCWALTRRGVHPL